MASKGNAIVAAGPSSGARLAPRVGIAKAKAIEEDFARRIAEVPDRFKTRPLPAARRHLRGIETCGAARRTMSDECIAGSEDPPPGIRAAGIFNALGGESIFFRGVGPGYDFYGVKFANGFAEFRCCSERMARPTMSSSGPTAMKRRGVAAVPANRI